MDAIKLVDSIIIELDRITVTGTGNMAIVLNSIQKLAALKNTLQQQAEEQDVHDKAE